MTILDVSGLTKHYPIHSGLLRREVGRVRAVTDVSFALERGETLALVGESGCGKTTLSRCIVRALAPTSGTILFTPPDSERVDLASLSRRALRPLRRHVQMIFQDPYSSLDPRMVVGDIIAEPLLVNGFRQRARQARVLELLDLVGLPAASMSRYPHAFSGGQRQRVGIARALALNPGLVVLDEPVSALDVSVQAQIVNLLLDLQDRLSLSMLFVAHDLSVVRHVSDRVAVMYAGRIVESARTDALYIAPRHPYTAALLASVPKHDPAQRGQHAPPPGEIADPAHLPPGCAFHPRCAHAVDRCRTELPALEEQPPGRWTACHRATELDLAGVT